jgi:hypothetical protein
VRPPTCNSTGRTWPSESPFGRASCGEGGNAGTHRNGPADQLDGLGVVPLLVGCHSEQVEGVGMVGVAAQEALVDPPRLLQLTSLMVFQGRVQVVRRVWRHRASSPLACPIRKGDASSGAGRIHIAPYPPSRRGEGGDKPIPSPRNGLAESSNQDREWNGL